MKPKLRMFKWLLPKVTEAGNGKARIGTGLWLQSPCFVHLVMLGSPATGLKGHFVWIRQRCPCSRYFTANCQKIVAIIIKTYEMNGTPVLGSPDAGRQGLTSPGTFPVPDPDRVALLSCNPSTWANARPSSGSVGRELMRLAFRLSRSVESFQHSR